MYGYVTLWSSKLHVFVLFSSIRLLRHVYVDIWYVGVKIGLDVGKPGDVREPVALSVCRVRLVVVVG